jgi:hypothetical protein
MLKGCAVALLALAVASGVSANDESGEATKKERLVCKMESVTGSRLKKKRTCMTAAQWDELAAASQKGVNDFVRESNNYAPNSNPNPGGGAM